MFQRQNTETDSVLTKYISTKVIKQFNSNIKSYYIHKYNSIDMPNAFLIFHRVYSNIRYVEIIYALYSDVNNCFLCIKCTKNPVDLTLYCIKFTYMIEGYFINLKFKKCEFLKKIFQ